MELKDRMVPDLLEVDIFYNVYFSFASDHNIKHSAQLYPFINIRVFKMIYQKVGKRLIWDPENSIITI